ncbi:MAG: hypothetical protein ABSD56_04665 [Bryobacteraceae bacterium]
MLRTWALFASLAPAALAQTATATLPLTLDQREEFLKTARLVRTRPASKGITGALRATLSDGNITHDAHIQTIDERKLKFVGTRGTEINFRDTYKFNIAAYRLGRLLGLGGMIPPSVDRVYAGTHASFTWWIDDVIGDEQSRLSNKITPPDLDSLARQLRIQQVFDQLIYNTDRNQGNTLYDKNWRLWMIDHSRAFRLYTTLKDKKKLQRCDRQLLAKLKQLDESTLDRELGQWLGRGEIKGILARRDRIVAIFEKLGPASLYTWLPEQ